METKSSYEDCSCLYFIFNKESFLLQYSFQCFYNVKETPQVAVPLSSFPPPIEL